MTLVRDGKISPEKAVEAALQLEENLEKANKRAEKKRQEDLERMTPKARQQALKLDKQRSAETRTGKDKRAGGGGAAMYVSPPATPTAGAFSGVSDLPATQMRLPDEKRIEVMAMVKSGELTVDQAMVRIRMLEKVRLSPTRQDTQRLIDRRFCARHLKSMRCSSAGTSHIERPPW